MAINSPKAITEGYIQASVGKAEASASKLFVLGIGAGLLIGMGATVSSTAASGFEAAGVVRMVSGLLFPVGLIMVILMGTELFTGNALMVTAAIRGVISWKKLLRNWVIVYMGNLVGAVGLAACTAFFGQLNVGSGHLAVYTATVAASKCALPWQNAFVLGIFCNLLVCVAVYLGNTSQETSGKIMGIYVPIMTFVCCGFEHCVANMYYIPAGIFANMNAAYAGMIADAGVNTALLNFGTFITANLIPVTLGNIVGGCIVGLMMYFAHADRKAK